MEICMIILIKLKTLTLIGLSNAYMILLKVYNNYPNINICIEILNLKI